MASNNNNLYNKLIALVRGCFRVIHAEVNCMITRVGGGNGSVSEAGWRGRDRKGNTGEGCWFCSDTMKYMEQRTQVSSEGGVPGQPGPEHPPGYQYRGWSLYLRVGRLKHYHYGRDEMTPRRSGGVLLGIPTVCGRGNPSVRPKCCQLSAGNWGAVYLRALYVGNIIAD